MNTKSINLENIQCDVLNTRSVSTENVIIKGDSLDLFLIKTPSFFEGREGYVVNNNELFHVKLPNKTFFNIHDTNKVLFKTNYRSKDIEKTQHILDGNNTLDIFEIKGIIKGEPGYVAV